MNIKQILAESFALQLALFVAAGAFIGWGGFDAILKIAG